MAEFRRSSPISESISGKTVVSGILVLGEVVTFCNRKFSPNCNLLAKAEIENKVQVVSKKTECK